MSLATFLGQARGITIEGDTVVISVAEKQGFLRNALDSPENLAVIQEEAGAALGRPMQVRVAQEAPPSDDLTAVAGRGVDDASSKRERLISEALKEPVVRTMMDLFKGQIVDIREGR
jgi:hypothetical protein